MPLYIMYFNLKDGVSEEEFVKKSKEFIDSGKVEGLGSPKLHRHHFGAHPRAYQMHRIHRFLALLDKDEKVARLLEEWHNLMDFKTHYDEFAFTCFSGDVIEVTGSSRALPRLLTPLHESLIYKLVQMLPQSVA